MAALMALASMVLREMLWRSGASFERVHFGFDTRCSSLLVGCALGAALATGKWKGAFRKGACLPVAAGVGAPSSAGR